MRKRIVLAALIFFLPFIPVLGEKDTFCTPFLTALDTTEAPIKAIHISAISIFTTTISADGWYTEATATYATATVTIVDVKNNPVAGAIVSGSWSGLTNDIDSDVTDINGRASLNSNPVKNAKGTFTFTVDDVTKDGWTYDLTSDAVRSASITVGCSH